MTIEEQIEFHTIAIKFYQEYIEVYWEIAKWNINQSYEKIKLLNKQLKMKTVPISDDEEVPIESVREDDKTGCYSCENESDEEKKKCDVCEWRGWNHIDMEWDFPCDCWAEEVSASCPENAYLSCDCMDD